MLQNFTRRLGDERSPVLAIALAALTLAVGIAFGFGVTITDTPVLLVVLPLLVLAVGTIVRRPEYGAVALIGVTWSFISDVLIKTHGLPSVAQPLVGLLLVLAIARRVGGKPLVSDQITWWFLGFVAITFLGLWYAPFPAEVSTPAIDLAKDFLIYLVLINLLDVPKAYERVVLVLLAIGAIYGTLSVVQELTNSYDNSFAGLAKNKQAFIAEGVDDRARAAGPLGDPNYYGQQLLMLVPLGLWAALRARSPLGRIAGAYATVMCVAGIVLSFSRGAYIALTFVGLLLAIQMRFNFRYLLALLVVLSGLWYIAPPEFTARFETLELINSDQGVAAEGSFQGRASHLIIATQMLADYPILGVGKGNYAKLYPEYNRETGAAVKDVERNAHNLYLQVAAEHGIVGLSVFVVLILLVVRRLREAQRLFAAAGNSHLRELATALRVSFYGYLVSALFLHDAYLIFFILLVAMAVALNAIAKRAVAAPRPQTI